MVLVLTIVASDLVAALAVVAWIWREDRIRARSLEAELATTAAALQVALDARAAAERPARKSWLDRKRRRQILVHQVDESSMRGVLLEQGEDGIVLGAAEYLGDGNATPLGGETFIPRERIAFFQAAPPAARASS